VSGIDEIAAELRALRALLERVEAAQEGLRSRLDLSLSRMVVPLAADLLAMRTPYGYVLVPPEDRALAVHHAEGTLPEPGTMAVLSRLISPGQSFVDVGANVGLYTLFGARLVGPSGHVIALEPVPRLARLLRQTVAMNGLSAWVDVHQAAAAEVSGARTLHVAFPYGHSSLYPLPHEHEQTSVHGLALDDLLSTERAIHCLKIDVEGAELDVLRGLQATLQRHDEIVVVLELGPSHLERVGITAAAWFDEIAQNGFTPWRIRETDGGLQRLGFHDIPQIFSTNVLLLRHSPEHYPQLSFDP